VISAVRVYLPASASMLRGVVAADGVGPAPFLAHAVTDALRAAYPEGNEEELEYAAQTAAARAALALMVEGEPPRRLVIAADADGVAPAPTSELGADPTLVEVGEPVPFRRLAAVLVDLPEAEEAVVAAAGRLEAADAGDPEAESVVDRCLDHDLAWYATQEIGDLLQTWE
jgi:hypothetical protein